MQEDNNNKNIPALRFPEFENEGEWEVKKLGEVCYNINSGKDKNINNGSFYLYGSTGVIGRTISYSYDGFYILVARVGANAGFLNKIKGKFSVTDNTLVVHLKETENVDFYYYLLEKKGLNKLVFGSGQPLITGGQLKSLTISIPSLAEQQKIASCLSSLDEVIQLESQKLETLQLHKKGLLQNLFPQEGESIPKIRFPEFQNSGEWEVKTLGEVAKFLKGKGISKTDIVENGMLPCIRYGQLYTHYKEIINDVISYTNIPAEELVLSKTNDVIIPSSGETQEDIATAACVMKDGIALGGDLNIIRSNINGIFLSYYLSNTKKREIAQMAQGISVVHLYSSQLQNLIIHFPSLPEQQKIAACLSSLDDLLKAQTERIELLKLHKKGLLQNLFPR